VQPRGDRPLRQQLAGVGIQPRQRVLRTEHNALTAAHSGTPSARHRGRQPTRGVFWLRKREPAVQSGIGVDHFPEHAHRRRARTVHAGRLVKARCFLVGDRGAVYSADMSDLEKEELRTLRHVAKAAQNLVNAMGVPEHNAALEKLYEDLVYALETWEAN
jgi:hypothetical protein